MVKRFFVLFFIILSVFTLSSCSGEKYADRKLSIDTNDVAILSICADNGKSESTFLSRNYGHAFLSVTNISEETLVIGDYDVKSDETITIGLWSIVEHFGVWYNVESNYIKEHNKYKERVSISIGINIEDIEQINKIISNNNSWTPTYNCAKFALEIWNKVSTESEKISVPMFASPSYLVNEIKRFNDHEFKKAFETSTIVRYYGEK